MTRERSSVSVERVRVRSRRLRGPGGRNETGAQESVLKQISDPFGVFDIRFPPRYRFDMLCVDNKDLEVFFQQVVNGFPEHSSAFHSDTGTIMVFEPIS